jgi:membrane-associated phospholipid phosphatase
MMMKPRQRIEEMVLGIFLPLLGLTGLAIATGQNPKGFSWERALLLSVHQTTRPELDYLAEKLTGLGTYWGVAPMMAILLGIFALKRYWYGFRYLLLTMGGGWAIGYTLKSLFHRARPGLWELFYPLPRDFAFPSGHALFTMLLSMALLGLSGDSRWSIVVLVVGIPFVITIAWTRLYLGVHFPSDILGGWFLAIAWSRIVHLWLIPSPER